MTKINQIWEELENDMSFSSGLLLRRYSGSVLPNVFIALQSPEKFRCVATSVSNNIQINLSNLSSVRDISVEIIAGEGNEKTTLLFKLTDNQHKDIFSVLCEDLIASISNVTDEEQLIKEMISRFQKWKSLFDEGISQQLSPEEQRGLFGELFLVRKFLRNNKKFLEIINSWVGQEKYARDFEAKRWSVEVKTTSGNDHQKVRISSERQLDTYSLEYLFLYHISLEARQQSGETLNGIVDSILEVLAPDFTSLNRFKSKLLEGGYFDHHRQHYGDIGYFIREETFYRVEGDFPRIEKKDVRKGVGEVTYSIAITGCSGFITPEQKVFQDIDF